MSIVKMSNITMKFKDKIALDNISINIEEGEIFGLIGPNGAGKTTLLNILCNLTLPNAGEVYVNNINMLKDPVKAKSYIALVPQELAFIETLTPYDNLEYFAALYGLKGKELKSRVNDVIQICGIEEYKRKKITKLSGGMKRRLNIAIALLNNPKVLILDEPTVGIDPQSRNHIFEALTRLSKENNMTIIYTSHYMEEVEQLCSNIFIIDEGREVAFGSQDYLRSLVFSNNKLILHLENIRGNLIYELDNQKDIASLTELNSNTLELTITSEFNLYDTLKIVENNKAIISKISYEKHSLEDVFLNLTGKNLRE